MITEDEILHLYERITEYNSLVRYYNRIRRQACNEEGNYIGPMKMSFANEVTAGAGDMEWRVSESVRACLMAHMRAVIDEAYKHVDQCAEECEILPSSLELEKVDDGNSED